MGNVEFPGVSELIYVRTYVNIHTYDRIYIERETERLVFFRTRSRTSLESQIMEPWPMWKQPQSLENAEQAFLSLWPKRAS